EQAKEAGVSTQGKVYLSSLAAYAGDPRAWVDSRGEAAKVCEERGWNMQIGGHSKVKGETPEPSAPLVMAEDLVQEKVQEVLDEQGQDAPPVEDIREKVIERHGAHHLARKK